MPDQDYWTDQYHIQRGNVEQVGFMTFVHYGKKYRLTKDLKTYCVGNVENKTSDVPPNPPQTKPDPPKVVMKQPANGIVLPQPNHEGVMKHPGGPKLKTSGFSRTTAWRRKKENEKQGVLIP